MPIVEITNTDRGPRGVNTADGLVMLAPGESQTGLDVPEAELADLPAYLQIADRTPSLAAMCAAIADPGAALSEMTVPALRALAAERGIKLPETGSGGEGRVVKADIVAAIVAAADVAAVDALDDMGDDELRATVHALTGTEPPVDADRAALLALARGI